MQNQVSHSKINKKLHGKNSCIIEVSTQQRKEFLSWRNEGVSNREIRRRLGRHHQTMANEIKRGTTTQMKEKKKTKLLYFADTGHTIYKENRKHCGSKSKLISTSDFIKFACKQIIDLKWAPDAIVGFIKSLGTWKID